MVTTNDNNRAIWQDPPTRAAVDTSAFPAELDPEFYRSQYPELAHFDAELLDQHYALYGINEGRPGNRIKDRRDFVALIPGTARVLEIGPYFSPLMVGDNVEYFDVLSRKDLIRRAVSQGVENPKSPLHPLAVADRRSERRRNEIRFRREQLLCRASTGPDKALERRVGRAAPRRMLLCFDPGQEILPRSFPR